ncbi:MAG TPA: aminoacyl-tRNA hydrolase [Bacteroidales bacterium]|nr:aminoacyl-tRNA hydrolase [Bacteroidales bacterium]
MKYLIVGLGNVGETYTGTRHNIGFEVLDILSERFSVKFKQERYAYKTTFSYAGKSFILIKPTTFVNLSGKSVRHWLQKEKIPIEKLLVVHDDIAFDFGTIKLKPKGNSGGHNGLFSIESILQTTNYAKLRFGIGNNFSYGHQVDYVLGKWTDEEKIQLPELKKKASEMIISFGKIGLERTMNMFNS